MTLNIFSIMAIAFIMLCQASWIFYDAAKRHENKWLWGLFGLMNCPSSLIIYLLITRRFNRQVICPHCFYSIKAESKYCSYCGEHITHEELSEKHY